jgi:hypothetical protein
LIIFLNLNFLTVEAPLTIEDIKKRPRPPFLQEVKEKKQKEGKANKG